MKDVASPVYAIVNPACDLVFRKKGRQPKDTLLLLPGDLRQLHEPPKGERTPSLITPLYLHTDNNVYRIDWDYRRLTTVPHDELRERYLVPGYRCDRRLHLGPALELQQHFTSASSRVGLPVPPPIGRSIDFLVFCRGKDGRWCSITPPGSPIKGGCFVYHMRDRDQFVVTNSAREDVLTQITTHCLELGKTGAEVGWEGGSTREQYKGNLNKSVQKWITGFPFHRALGDLPGSRNRKEKECEAKDRLGFAVGTTYAKSVKADIDVLLCLNIGPMPIRPFEGDLAREMDQL